MLSDLRYAVRMMRRTPLVTSAIVATVALAIATNTAIFSLVNAVLLRPLPFADPGRIVQVAEKNDKLNLPTFGASVLNFLSWREQTRAFDTLAALGFANYTLVGAGDPEQLSGNPISPALTRVLGVAPVAGRSFRDDEEKPGATPVAMIGEGLWKRRFGSDPSVVGRAIVLNGTPTMVVGIAPASLNLISGGDVYTPLTIDTAREMRLNHVIIVFGRLRAGVTLAQAQSDMDAVAARVGQQYPEVRDWGIHLVTLFDTFVSPQLETGLLILLAAVVCVLLIACANIASLLLARAVARQQEMAVRTAMGADGSRLLRQLLVESVVLAASGGAAGVVGAVWIVRALNAWLPPATLPIPAVPVDAAVLMFAAGLTTVAGLLFGLAPAWRMSRVDLNDVLKRGGRGSSGGVMARVRNGLAAAELALATILLIAAGLLVQSLANLQRVELGFEPGGLLTFELSPPAAKYPVTTKAPQLYQALLAALRSTPGVTGAAASSRVPFGAGYYTTHPMLTTSRSVLPPDTRVPINWRIVTPGYFAVMRTPILRGRDFTDADGAAASVIIVSESTAKKFFGDDDPIGRTLTRSADLKTPFTIVGVVGDVRDLALNQQAPGLYYPAAARTSVLMDIVVRTPLAPDAVLAAVRERVRALDAELALANVRTEEEWVSASAAQPRLNSLLLGAFALVALVIAAIGIYSVLSYAVTQRTREIGLRMALGATPRSVLRLVVGDGMVVVATGIAIGLAGGFALGQTMSSLVFGVTVRDPKTFAAVAVCLTAVALGACAIPARRAARVDPLITLRHD